MISFLTENTKGFVETETIGSFSAGSKVNDFDSLFAEAHSDLSSVNVDPMVDINLLVKNPVMMESFKDKLLSQLQDDCRRFDAEGISRYATLYEQTSAMFDNCLEDLKTESTRVGQLLPIKAVDFPVLIKQTLALASKDIMQTEVTKTPVIKKHIERRWIVDKKSGKRWEYPQCFFKDDWKEIYEAGKGLKIDHSKAVSLAPGACFNYDVRQLAVLPAGVTDWKDLRDSMTMDLRITAVALDGAEDLVPVQMRINLSDNSWLGGNITDPATGEIVDVITGSADFIHNTVTLSSASGKVTAVYFDGFLSNELNERSVTFDKTREEFEWKIEDGFRAEIAYSLEELQDAKALMDIDLYRDAYNDMADTLIQMEDNGILDYLDEMYAKYRGIEVDTLGFHPFIREQTFDCDHTSQTMVLQSEYIQKQLKFLIDRFLIDIMDTAKMENMTFVLYGNPRYISLLDPEIKWVVRSGDSVGGVKLNYSYGIMNAAGVKIQVVSTMKYNARDGRRLRLIPYPTTKDQFTFKHYKYTTHILTSQNSGYRPADRPGGSMTYMVGTTRHTTATIQGIQGSMMMQNTPFILGSADIKDPTYGG